MKKNPPHAFNLYLPKVRFLINSLALADMYNTVYVHT